MLNSQPVLIVTLKEEADLLEAVRRVRERAIPVIDVYTPYPVHGLSQALGMPPSRLPLVAFGAGLFGAAFILSFQFWTSNTNWPLTVGGKPFNSLPAFIPATFEMMVLFAGYGAAIALFAVCGLAFGRRPKRNFPRATDDRFILLLEQNSAAAATPHLLALLEGLDVETEEELWETEGRR